MITIKVNPFAYYITYVSIFAPEQGVYTWTIYPDMFPAPPPPPPPGPPGPPGPPPEGCAKFVKTIQEVWALIERYFIAIRFGGSNGLITVAVNLGGYQVAYVSCARPGDGLYKSVCLGGMNGAPSWPPLPSPPPPPPPPQ